MNRIATFLSTVLVLLSSGVTFAQLDVPITDAPDHESRLSFEANLGQADEQTRFLARGEGFRLLLSSSDATWLIPQSRAIETRGPARPLRMSFVGADPSARIEGEDALPGKTHYLVGRQAESWVTHVPTYSAVRYRDLYPGVDLTFRNAGQQMEFQFVVAPGIDPNIINLEMNAETIEVDPAGALIVQTGGGFIRHQRPVVYQPSEDGKLEIEGEHFLLEGGGVGYGVGSHDADRPVYIGVAVDLSGSVGNADASHEVGIAIDNSGNTFISGSVGGEKHWGRVGSEDGRTYEPAGPEIHELADAFVIKLDSGEFGVAYTTYFGGSGDDLPSDLATDGKGQVVVVGQTGSSDFPAVGAPQSELSGSSDAFVARLSADGSGFVHSTLLGGDGADSGRGIALDASGNIWVAGQTGSTDFPTVATALQPEPAGRLDAFVVQLSPDGLSLLHASYIGGSESDSAESIVVDPQGNAYLTGWTNSPDFPLEGSLSLPDGEPGAAGMIDGFVMKIDADAAAPVYSVYLGGSDDDAGTGIAVDATGDAYVTGWTNSSDLPTTPQAEQGEQGGSTDGFLAKLSGNSGTLVYSTYLGGPADDRASDICLGAEGSPWLTGTTDPADSRGLLDAFVIKLDPESLTPVRSVYVGGAGADLASAIALDPAGHAVIVGTTGSPASDVIRKIESTALGGDVFVSVVPAAVPLAGCPGTVNFDNDSTDGLWQTASNWDTDTLPISTDDVCIGSFDVTLSSGTQTIQSLIVEAAGSLTISGGSLSLSTASQIDGAMTQSGGTLTGAGDLTIGGVFDWTGGMQSGTGATNAQGGLNLTGGVKTLQRTLNNSAVATYNSTSSGLVLGSTAVFNNLSGATFDAQNDTNLTFGGGSPTFINDGTFVKSGGTGTTSLPGSIPFVNDGSVDVQSGTLELNVGATHGGSFDCTGGTLSFDGGTHTLSAAETLTGTHVLFDSGTVNLPGGYNVTGNTTIAGATANFTGSITGIGSLVITSGTVNLSNTEGVVTQPTFTQTTGTLTGSSDLNVTGVFDWTGGTQSGTGATNAQGGLNLTGGVKTLQRTLNNSAVATYNSTSSGLVLGSTAVFNNLSGATFDAQNDTNLTFGGGSPTFINDGTFVKSGGTGTTILPGSIPFVNDGSVDVQSGTLELNYGATHGGSFDCTGGTLSFDGGTHTLSAAETLTGTHVLFDSGTVNLPGGYNVTGNTTIAGATANFTGSITGIGSLVITSGTVNLSNTEGVVTQPTFTQTTGTLTGSSDLNVTGVFDWTGGTQSGTGATNAQGGLNLTGGVKTLQRTLNNSAVATYNSTSSGLVLGSTAVFNNLSGATFDAQNDTNLTFGGGSPTFINDGTFVKSGGTGTTSLPGSIPFVNDGSVDVQSGTLELNYGATHGGSFDCTGGTLSFDGGTHTLSAAETLTGTHVLFDSGTVNLPGGYNVTGNTTIAGATANFTGSITGIGSLVITSGTVNLSNTEGVVTQPTFTQTTGTLTGSSDLNVTGVFDWTGGTQSGTGATNAQGGLNLTGGVKTLQRTLNNSAVATYNSTSSGLVLGSTAVFNNLSGATFDAQNDTNLTFGGGSPTFINDGTFVKSGGTGTTILPGSIPFVNDGSVDVQSGTLELNYGATHGGSFDCTGGTLSFDGGTHTLSAAETLTGTHVLFDSGTVNLPGGYNVTGNTTIAGATANFTGSITGIGSLVITSGTVNLSNTEGVVTQPTFTQTTGTLTGSSDLNVTGVFNWTGGTQSGTGATNAQGGLNLTGGVKTLQRTLNNSAVATYNSTSSGLVLASTAVFNNLSGATFDAQNDTNLTFGGGSPQFNNAGTFRKSAGAGTTTVNNVSFTNSGAVEALFGTLTIGDFTQTAGSTTVNGGLLTSSNTLDIQGGTLNGVGTVTAPTVDSAGQVAPGLSTGVLTISGAYTQQAGGSFAVELGGIGCPAADTLEVSGPAMLDGDLDVTLIEGCQPMPGQTFTLMTASTVSGSFANFAPPQTPCPLAWNIVYNAGSVVLEVLSGTCLDGDGDTFSDCCGTCTPDVGDACADCDDADPVSYPGAPELCDGTDNDCDTVVPVNEIDDDADLYVECTAWNDTQGNAPAILGGDDCDDADAASFPGAAELCDGNDNDCDSILPVEEVDDDGDFYVDCTGWDDTQADQPAILGGADCDDTDLTSFPGAAELCDGNDNDCDSVVPTDEIDGDGDFYVACTVWDDTQADQPAILGGNDCAPADPLINPAATEVCDGSDNDCSGVEDDGDADMDGFLVCADCNDGNELIHAIPSEARNLRFPTDKSDLLWDPPIDPGGSVVDYDTIRSSAAADFVTAAFCVESDDGTDTAATDGDIPGSGLSFYYLVRPENDCGLGSAGVNSGSQERAVNACP